MLVTDFDRSRGAACELCPAPIIAGQPFFTCIGCSAKRVHEYCSSYVLSTGKGWWCCSNCRDARPKRAMDPNLSLRTGSSRTRKAPDTYQVIDTRGALGGLGGISGISGIAASRRSRAATPPMALNGAQHLIQSQLRSDTPLSLTSAGSAQSSRKDVSEGDSMIVRLRPVSSPSKLATSIINSTATDSADDSEESKTWDSSSAEQKKQGSDGFLNGNDLPHDSNSQAMPTRTPSTPAADIAGVSESSPQNLSARKRKSDHSIERPRSPIVTRLRKRSNDPNGPSEIDSES